MVGRISVDQMGSGLRKETDLEEQNQIRKEIEIDQQRSQKNRKVRNLRKNAQKSVLGANIESFEYYPRSESSKKLFASIQAWCSKQLDDDVPESVVRSMADIVVAILQGDSSEKEKKKQIEDTVDHSINDQDYGEVSSLSGQIDDFHVENTEDQVEDDDEDEDENSEDDEEDEDDDNEHLSSQSESETNEESDQGSEVVLKPVHAMADIDINSIDKYWISRFLAKEEPTMDSYQRTEASTQIAELLEQTCEGKLGQRKLETELAKLCSEPVSLKLTTNNERIYYGLKLSEDRDGTLKLLHERGLESLVTEASKPKRPIAQEERPSKRSKVDTPRFIDLNNLVFDQGSRLMTTSKFQLPKGSFKRAKKSWEEIHIPPPPPAKQSASEKLIPITHLPEWAQEAFPSTETKTLNRIQSKVFPQAFKSNNNILMCAPTGAGKTNAAMLTVLHTLEQFRNADGQLQLNNFKIVYIAPLKALVQEQVREFQRRLAYLDITVNELTGDSNLTKHQVSTTQILVTTPEKWDVITRKNNEASYAKLVRLVIIDEIHLLHDERGPVIESIVARTLRDSENVRLVGLSATLPNYTDVAEFLHVDDDGLFYFDASYRPCPLAQQFVGITEKKSLKKYQAMNEACYDKVVETLSEDQQAIVFVHSRKDTAKTAKYIVDRLKEEGQLDKLIPTTTGGQEILRQETTNAKSEGLKAVLSKGFGIHHAGMKRQDRSTVEDLFAQGYIKVLVSTATLAWGVNLPAHTVVIKGTSVYSPEQSAWVQLSPQDILQMLGRAGRPRYDTHGEGIIITSQDDVKYYLAILNQQLAIESQMYSKLVDDLNAEIVAERVNSLNDCVNWLQYTYLYVRMLHDRTLYRVGPDYDDDPKLHRRCTDLAYSALMILVKNGLLKYEYHRDILTSTDLGKVASYYYISYESIRKYSKQLKPYLNEIELFHIFAGSEEFKYLRVRDEEQGELRKLLEKVPIPVNEPMDDPLAKTNVLLQAYISRMQLDGFALMSDMVYIVQSAGRLFRAMFELALRKNWAGLASILLNVCKMVDNRMWLTNSPLRQFPTAPKEIIVSVERSMTPWKEYLAIRDNQKEITRALKAEKFGSLGYELMQKFPQVSVECTAEPLTSSLLRVNLDIVPKWKWDVDVHGFSESFTVFVEDCDSEMLFYHTSLIVRKQYIDQHHHMEFTISAVDQPNIFVSVVSDKWLNCETREPLVLTKIQLPKRFPAPTTLLDIPEIANTEQVFDFDKFNMIECQVFDPIYNEKESVLCCCSKGNGKTTVLSVLSLLNHWKNERGRAIYLNPTQEVIDTLYKNWKKKFADYATVNKLTGDLSVDLKLLAESHFLLATPKQFDLISRRWQKRKNVQSIELIIADDCHAVAQTAVYENVLSRMRFMATTLKKDLRMVALGLSIASSRDFAEWLGIKKTNIFDFDSKERVYPVSVKFDRLEIRHNPSAIDCMVPKAYNAVCDMNEDLGEEKSVIFVPTRRECIDIAAKLVHRLIKGDYSWLRTEQKSLEPYLKRIQDASVKKYLKYGIGCYYESMNQRDRTIIEKLFKAGALSGLVASKETCRWCPPANLVVVLSTDEYDGSEHRYVGYPLDDLFEMIGLSRVENGTSKALVLTNSGQVGYYQKFIAESLPLESQMKEQLADCLIPDISTGIVKNRQNVIDWITFTWFSRRLQMNPSYYGLDGVSTDSISEYLSELVESVLKDLADSKLVELNYKDEEDEEQEITPLNGCMIAAYHDISFGTMQTYASSLTATTRLKKLLEIVSSASEFQEVPIRSGEASTLFRLYSSLPVKWTNNVNFESPTFKTFVLLQAHFSQLSLPPDLARDLQFILSKVLSLLYAAVDSLSSEGWLNAMSAMDLGQMVVQGLWDSDSPLKQVPYFDESILAKCVKLKVETIYDIMALEDDERDQLLDGLSELQVSKVAEFVNQYPNLEITYDLDTNIVANKPHTIKINISRDEEPDDLTVVSTQFPLTKSENWWVVVGEHSTRQLYAIKKLSVDKQTVEVPLEFTIPDKGKHNLSIWCICDSYMDADKQIEIAGVVVK